MPDIKSKKQELRLWDIPIKIAENIDRIGRIKEAKELIAYGTGPGGFQIEYGVRHTYDKKVELLVVMSKNDIILQLNWRMDEKSSSSPILIHQRRIDFTLEENGKFRLLKIDGVLLRGQLSGYESYSISAQDTTAVHLIADMEKELNNAFRRRALRDAYEKSAGIKITLKHTLRNQAQIPP